MSMCTEVARPGASSGTEELSLSGWHFLRRVYVYSEKNGVIGAIRTAIEVSTSYIQNKPGEDKAGSRNPQQTKIEGLLNDN